MRDPEIDLAGIDQENAATQKTVTDADALTLESPDVVLSQDGSLPGV